MPMQPWMQPATLPPGAEQQVPQAKKNWWERGTERYGETGGFTMPWQPEHWANQPAWTRNVGKFGLGVGMAAGIAGAGMGVPGAMFGIGSRIPWLGGLAKAGLGLAPKAGGFGKLGAMGKLGGLGGLFGSAFMAPGSVGRPPTAQERAAELETIRGGLPKEAPGDTPVQPQAGAPKVGDTRSGTDTSGRPTIETYTEDGTWVSPEMGAGMGDQPRVVTVNGRQFWWDKVGGIYGTGSWEVLPEQKRVGTLEDQIAKMRAEFDIGQQQASAQQTRDIDYKRQVLEMQSEATRQQQAEATQQQIAAMYLQDPYKYWAQLGQGTPESVAALTGGQLQAGQPAQYAQMGLPSAQWWGSQAPSQQQQVLGGLNWMGVDPQDWLNRYQQLIPGSGGRPTTTWAK